MAGRVAQRPAPVSVLALDSVPDSATQRAFDATQSAVQDAQAQVRRLRTSLDETDVDVARITAFRNVAEFGAVGDGVTDDTQAIQLTLDAAEGAEAVVYLTRTENGRYAISDTIYVPNKVVLTGAGRGDMGLIASPSFPNDGRPMVRLGRASDTLVFGTRVENMVLDGNGRAGTIAYSTCAQEQSGVRFVVATNFTQYGIHFTNDGANFTSGVFVENAEIYPQNSGATTGIFMDGVALDNRIERVTLGVSGHLTNGLHVRSVQCIAIGVHVENCNTGLNLDSNSATVIMGADAGFIADVDDLIVDQGNNHHIGINLVKNSATRLITSNFGGYTNSDPFMPLWVGGDSIIGGALHLPREESPAQITSNQNDYNPGGQFSSTYVVRISSDAARDVTGLLAQNKGREIWLDNVGAFNITLKHQSASSAAANRFIGRAGADVVLLPGTAALLLYSLSQSRWRVMNNP